MATTNENNGFINEIEKIVPILIENMKEGLEEYKSFVECLKNEKFIEKENEKEEDAIKRAESIYDRLDEMIKRNDLSNKKSSETIEILIKTTDLFKKIVNNTENEKEKLIVRNNELIDSIIDLEQRKTNKMIELYPKRKNEINGGFYDKKEEWDEHRIKTKETPQEIFKKENEERLKRQQERIRKEERQPIAFPQYRDNIFHKISFTIISLFLVPNEEQKKEEQKVVELNVERYLGRENDIKDDYKVYENFQLSNGKVLYVNIWKKGVNGRCDLNVFSNVFPYNNGYLINVLLDQVLDSKNSFKKWKESIMLGFDYETICSEPIKNYVITDKYFIPIIDQYFIVKIPLVLPFPSFVPQSPSTNQYLVFNDFSKGPQSKHFIVIYRNYEKK